nr:MAG TPA: Helix-turn-helix XRE-family like protein [Caudoviricetes sp.]
MENEILKKLSLDLCCDKQNYMKSFRKNVDMYVSQKDITLREIAEKANLSFDTLKNFLYKNNSDCKLSTAVKLAKALNTSIDELVGSETISKETRNSLSMCRNLPENDLYLVRWYIRYIYGLNAKNKPSERYISVMELECNLNGNLQITSRYKRIIISDIDKECWKKVFFGITMPCNYYMPIYSPYDILLIANDRPPMHNENSLIRIGGILYVVKRKEENGKIKYFSIRDNKFRFYKTDIDEEIGYVAKTILV